MPTCLATKICVDCKLEKNIMLDFGLLKKPSNRCKACRCARAKKRRHETQGRPTRDYQRRNFSFAIHARRIDPRDKCLMIE